MTAPADLAAAEAGTGTPAAGTPAAGRPAAGRLPAGRLPAGRLHLVGIGGAGMSGLARLLHDAGREVDGCDARWSPALDRLAAAGIGIAVGNDPAHVTGAGGVVVSTAVPHEAGELVAARAAGIEVLPRGTALAAIMRGRSGVVVAGTHGKTTTTAMLLRILQTAGLDPAYAVGGELDETGDNAALGGGGLFVAESDESDGSFLELPRSVALVTNVDTDHLEHYGDLAGLRDAFESFVAGVAPGGAVVLCVDNPAAWQLRHAVRGRVIGYGAGAAAAAQAGVVLASDVRMEGLGSRFTLARAGPLGQRPLGEIALCVPGSHNVADAAGAAAAALWLGAPMAAVTAALGGFHGVGRRFQPRGQVRGVTIVDDYAHHPTEVTAVLDAAAGGPWQRVVAVFQPHRYSRTAALAGDLGRALAGGADVIVVCEVYAAGEAPLPGVSGAQVAAAARAAGGREVRFVQDRAALAGVVAALLVPGDLLLTLGAGDVTTLPDEVAQRLRGAAAAEER